MKFFLHARSKHASKTWNPRTPYHIGDLFCRNICVRHISLVLAAPNSIRNCLARGNHSTTGMYLLLIAVIYHSHEPTIKPPPPSLNSSHSQPDLAMIALCELGVSRLLRPDNISWCVTNGPNIDVIQTVFYSKRV